MSNLPALGAGEELGAGDQSDHVFALQERLAELGCFHDTADGVFGESTEDAVREFQRVNGLPEDGRVGEETWAALASETAGFTETEPAPETGQVSEDGQWVWDGEQWQAATPQVEVGQLSEDGEWRWDGEQWQPNESPQVTFEQFQELIAQSMTVHSDTA